MWLCGCHALPKLGQGSGCVSPHLALPGQRLSSLGRAGREPCRMDSALPPLRQLWETADSSLQSTPASLHPCSPGRPAQHTSAPVQSHWRGPWASAIPHPLQTLLLIDYSSCNSKRTQCAHFMWVVSRPCAQQTAKEAPAWGLCCCTMFLQTTM